MADSHQIEVTHTDGTKKTHTISDEQLRALKAAGFATGTAANILRIRAELIRAAKYLGKLR